MEGDEEGPTSKEESDEEDPEIADGSIPVQASATGDVQKMVGNGTPQAKWVVPPKSSVVEGGDPPGGTPSGTPAGGDPPQKKEEPPPQKEKVPPPLVVIDPKPKGRVKEPAIKEVMTPAKLQRSWNNMGNDPPTLRK